MSTLGKVSDVFETAATPMSMAIPVYGSIVYVNGSNIAIPTIPERPGNRPIVRPTITPKNRKNSRVGSTIEAKACVASSMVTASSFDRGPSLHGVATGGYPIATHCHASAIRSSR